MRPTFLAVAIVGGLLLVGLPSAASSGHAMVAPPIGNAASMAPLERPAVSPRAGPAAWDLNTTLSPELTSRSAASPTPISALSPTPLPPVPDTQPTVMYFANASKNCCVSANFTAPAGGPWALIVLNYTGEAVLGVYDSSFRAYVDQAQVFFGTTPEYGIWYDEADLTPYSSLFHGTFNFTFLLGAAVTSGYFLTSVSILFYPVPAGGSAPVEPNLVIPLWHRVFVSTTSAFVWDVGTIPQNVTNATLQLWAYGFGPDEFWYASQPALRTIEVSVDNSTVLDFLPFQYINTGGNDLFAWRPITGAFTLSDRPYDLDVTGLLGSMEGTHNFTATVTGVTSGSSWLVGGSLLLYTNSTAAAATSPTSTFSAGTPHVVSSTHSYQEFVNDSYIASSEFGTGSTATAVSVFTNTSYQDVVATSTGWENLTALERVAQTVLTVGSGTTTVSVTTWTFPLSANLGSVFVPNAGQGTGYPIYGNVTDYMLDLQQEWNETATSSTLGGAATSARPATSAVDYRVTGGNNLFVGTEELISANAAQLLSITFVQSATTADYRASRSDGGPSWSYEHLLIGSGYNPPPPNEVETVLVDQVADPLDATLTVSPLTADVGQTIEVDAQVVGGTGSYTYSYLGLPPGCVASDAPIIACRPLAAGLYPVGLEATDASGSLSPSTLSILRVLPAPSLMIAGNGSQLDAGVTGTFSAQVSGGLAPYGCTWTVPGNPIQQGDCGVPYNTSGSVPGTVVSGTVELVDANGVAANATFSFTVVPTLAVTWAQAPPETASAPTALTIQAVATDGVAPYTFAWLLNGSVVESSTDPNFTLVMSGAGTFSLLVEVTDADGAQAVEGPSTVAATAVGPGPGGESSPATSSPSLEWALLAAAGAGAVGLVVGIWVGRSYPGRRAKP